MITWTPDPPFLRSLTDSPNLPNPRGRLSTQKQDKPIGSALPKQRAEQREGRRVSGTNQRVTHFVTASAFP